MNHLLQTLRFKIDTDHLRAICISGRHRCIMPSWDETRRAVFGSDDEGDEGDHDSNSSRRRRRKMMMMMMEVMLMALGTKMLLKVNLKLLLKLLLYLKKTVTSTRKASRTSSRELRSRVRSGTASSMRSCELMKKTFGFRPASGHMAMCGRGP